MYIHDFFQNFLKTFLVGLHGDFTNSVIALDMSPITGPSARSPPRLLHRRRSPQAQPQAAQVRRRAPVQGTFCLQRLLFIFISTQSRSPFAGFLPFWCWLLRAARREGTPGCCGWRWSPPARTSGSWTRLSNSSIAAPSGWSLLTPCTLFRFTWPFFFLVSYEESHIPTEFL